MEDPCTPVHLLQETLFLSVDILDRYLQCATVSKKQLQLVGATCLLVAAKYKEVYPPFHALLSWKASFHALSQKTQQNCVHRCKGTQSSKVHLGVCITHFGHQFNSPVAESRSCSLLLQVSPEHFRGHLAFPHPK